MQNIYISHLELLTWAKDHATDKIPVEVIYELAMKAITDEIQMLELLIYKKGAEELKREIDLIEKSDILEKN